MNKLERRQDCFGFKPIHNDNECCWCDYLHQLFDEGYYDYLYTIRGERN